MNTPYTGYEYKSSFSLLGLPFIHVASGVDPETGRLLIAKGIIAIGNIAFGVLAIGGFGLGLISLGGVSLGIIAIGGVSCAAFFALGGVAFSLYIAGGGVALAGHIAFGGLAMSLNYAFGGFAVGRHPYGSNYKDPIALEYLQNWLRSIFGPLKW